MELLRPFLWSRRIAPRASAAWLGAVHLLVDAATVTAALRSAPPADAIASSAFGLVLGYDLLAFAGQLPLGLLLDRWRARRACAAAGVLLAMAAMFTAGEGSLGAVLLAGIGNALFHVAAGALVLEGSAGRAAPAGVFVAPGALGLAAGLLFGRVLVAAPLWPLHLLLVAAALVCVLVPDGTAPGAPPRSVAAAAGTAQAAGVLALLFFSTFVRSFVGAVACDGCPKGLVLLCAVPAAGFAGKLAGGFLADRRGFAEVATWALATSAPLLGYADGSLAAVLAGLVLFHMTMPVTLAATYRLAPHRPAAGFGLLCVALVLGAVAAQWPGVPRPRGVVLCLWILASAAALVVALRRLAPAPSAPRPVSTSGSSDASTLGEVSR